MSLFEDSHRRLRKDPSGLVIETVDICVPQPGEVCILNKYVGVNTTDVLVASSADVNCTLGFEGVGMISTLGDDVKNDLKPSQFVYYTTFAKQNAFAEYACVSSKEVIVIPEAKSEYIALFGNGLTAFIGLDKVARIRPDETVLITNAAGGIGHIAVQYAKMAFCDVIGTCSTKEEEILLKDLGCDRIINYKEENLDEILSKEYENGINVIWETIGGMMFETCLKHLSKKGRLVIVGSISGYISRDESGLPNINLSNLAEQLLMKSACLQGFLVQDYAYYYPTYVEKMIESYENNQLRLITDNGEMTCGSEFFGIEGIIKAIEHIRSGRNLGKFVVVRIY